MRRRPTQSVEQTTTTFGPTTTIDRVALAATWEWSGNWLIVEPDADPASSRVHGFVVFGVDIDASRLTSVGYGQCFLYGGRTVETDDTIKVVPRGDSVGGLVQCDPGEATTIYDDAVSCLQTGCEFGYDGSVIRLSDEAARVADLVPTTDDVP